MKRLLLVIPALALVLAFAGQAKADVVQVPWGRQGAENLPCPGGAHWVMSPGHGVTTATVAVNATDWGMVQAWDADESWYINTGPVTAADTVVLAYIGAAPTDMTLTLTACVGTAPPSPTPTITAPPPTPSPPSPTPTPSPSPTPAPTFRHKAVVICKSWTKHNARHVRLIRFKRNGTSVYRCI